MTAGLAGTAAPAAAHHRPDERYNVYYGDTKWSDCYRDGRGGVRSGLWDRYNCTQRNPSAVELWVHKIR